MRHTVYILGSAQDAGLPQFGSRAAPDMAARLDPLSARLGPSLAVVSQDGRCLLVDVSPDIKAQEERLLRLGSGSFSARFAEKVPDPFPTAIALTHAHMGHYAGLVHFGREAASTRGIPCYCTHSMAAFLARHAPWEQLLKLGNLQTRSLENPVEVWPGLRLSAFKVPHRSEYTDTVALSINGRLLYCPDIDDWEQWPRAREIVSAHEVSLLDATFYSADELPGRDMREVPHPLVTRTMDFFAQEARKRRLILTHLNHTNPLCDPSSEASKEAARRGFEVAQEMLAIAV